MSGRWFVFGAVLTALLAAGCGSRRAVSPTTEPVDGGGQVAGDGYTVSRDGHVAHPRDAFFREGIVFDSCAFTVCGGACVDTSSDPSNCGACYAPCSPGFICQGGGCTCPGSLTDCYGTCVDLTSDPANCGSCGNACSWGQPCVNGVCSAAPSACQTKLWQNHVYLFCQAAVSWADASAACKVAGKHLVTINDAAENTWVYNETLAGVGWWWIGFNDLKTEGQWVWEDGTPVGYTNWAPSEPNDAGGEDCANLGFYQGALWNDQSCSEPGSYICESPLVCTAVCNGVCVDLQYDNNNCGACGAKCDTTSGFQCQWGKCACVGGLTECLGKCVDLSSDPANCGSCNATCAAGFVCQNGACSKSPWSGLQLNGSATLVGGVLRLTQAQSLQNGSAFTTNPITVTNSTTIATHFRFRMHGGSGADGLAFVLHNDPRGSFAIASGGEGGDLAYADLLYYNGTQIVNSLAVEFDTYLNGSPYCDPDDNHVGIGTNGTFLCVTQGVAFDLDSGSPVYAWVEYTPGVLNVYLSTTPAKPPAPMLSHNVDLMALVGKQAFVGFTGATGGATNFHDIEAWTFSSAP